KLLNVTASSSAFRSGKFYELNIPGFTNKNYANVRYTDTERMIVVANFDRTNAIESNIKLPAELIAALHLAQGHVFTFIDMLRGEAFSVQNIDAGIQVKVPPSEALILRF
ncbi:MAG: alpha-amylase, partial [Bacteroidota bacterium]|nr:alpha-amylase [Bacteroidota bacterium]